MTARLDLFIPTGSRAARPLRPPGLTRRRLHLGNPQGRPDRLALSPGSRGAVPGPDRGHRHRPLPGTSGSGCNSRAPPDRSRLGRRAGPSGGQASDLYREALSKLEADGLLYRVLLHPPRSAKQRRPLTASCQKVPTPGTCRELTEDREGRAPGCRPAPALQVRAAGARVGFDDHLRPGRKDPR